MITIEVVDEAWSNLDKLKETAEQHDFPQITIYRCTTRTTI